jgi:hypothetical protein
MNQTRIPNASSFVVQTELGDIIIFTDGGHLSIDVEMDPLSEFTITVNDNIVAEA